MKSYMHNPIKSSNPRPILYAQWALYAWIVWTCLFGICQTWAEIPEIKSAMGDQLEGVLPINPDQILMGAIAGYTALALFTFWFAWEIGRAKKWARSSFLWGFILQAVWTFCPPYHPILTYLSDVPDLGFQAYALYLLYSKQANRWFDLTAK